MAEDRIYLTVGKDPEGRGLLAIISIGHPQRGDDQCKVLDLEIVKNMKAAKAWYRRMRAEKPWVSRD